jgi:aspartate ammonia-lyase
MVSIMENRIEKDLLGEKQVPANALYGIHTVRATENFPLSGRKVHPRLIQAYGEVKLACAQTNHELGHWEAETFNAISQACSEMMSGLLNDSVIVDALQGGAGTSTNMNVNEVIVNRTLEILNKKAGEYDILHPIEDINLHQSTNDTYPTALKIAAIHSLRELEKNLVFLLETFQRKEKETAHIVKVGRTQMQDAVLTTMGRTMAAYAEAFGRDRWRVYKCEERLRVVNLGGTAIGTGLAAPRKYIFRVVENLKNVSGIGVARAENLIEATQNNDALVEVSGILNACASNLLKVSSDLRFMSSGPGAGIGEIKLKALQAGSSIMPGKVNPVIPEAVSQAAMKVISNNNTISQAVAMGNLELNAFMPLIADALLESLDLLINSCSMLAKCAETMEIDEKVCSSHVAGTTATLTALIHRIGYENAEKIIEKAEADGTSIKETTLSMNLLTEAEFDQLVSAEAVTRLGNPMI